MKERISVCIPTYNAAATVLESVNSILTQTLADFELVIVDNASSDGTFELLQSVKDQRIKLYRNPRNLGCAGNLNICKSRASGEIIFFLCSDDLADKNALSRVYQGFMLSEEIGVVLRPYYWFDKNVFQPVRLTRQFSADRIVSLNGAYKDLRDVIELSGQISGIGFRKKFINFNAIEDHFIEMASLVLPVLAQGKALILKDNIVAVRTGFSGAMDPAAYIRSPMLRWYNLISNTYNADIYQALRAYLTANFISTNFIGLVQIKNFSSYRSLLREIWYLIKFKWINIFNLKFWFFALGTIITPRFLLRKMVVFFKNSINTKLIQHVAITVGKRRCP